MTAHPTNIATPVRRLFLNLGHFFDHLFLPLFPTVVLVLEREWGQSYESLLWPMTVGLVCFACATLPAGWLGDRWSREGMMVLFFLGIGGSSVATGLAEGTLGLALGLGGIGLFAAIYHPVGLAMVVSGTDRMGRVLGVNGVWGNMGVAAAALTAGLLADRIGWRAAFIVPGLACMATGICYLIYLRFAGPLVVEKPKPRSSTDIVLQRQAQIRVLAVVLVTALCGGMIFGSMTVVLPKALQDGLPLFADSTENIGRWAASIFALASFAQLVTGRLIDSREARPLLFLAGLGQAACLLLLAGGSTGLLLPLAALGVMLFAFGQIPMNDTLVARYTDAHWRARVYSLKYVMTFGVATMQVPLIVWLRRLTGDFSLVYALLTTLGAIIAGVALLLPLARPRATVAAAPVSVPAGGSGSRE